MAPAPYPYERVLIFQTSMTQWGLATNGVNPSDFKFVSRTPPGQPHLDQRSKQFDVGQSDRTKKKRSLTAALMKCETEN